MNRVDSSTDEVTSNSLHRLHRTTSGSILIGKLFKLLAAVIYSIYSVDNITETRFFILTKQLTGVRAGFHPLSLGHRFGSLLRH